MCPSPCACLPVLSVVVPHEVWLRRRREENVMIEKLRGSARDCSSGFHVRPCKYPAPSWHPPTRHVRRAINELWDY
jgi:hypothetical protein